MAYGGISSIGRESREITLRNARNKIRALGQQGWIGSSVEFGIFLSDFTRFTTEFGLNSPEFELILYPNPPNLINEQ